MILESFFFSLAGNVLKELIVWAVKNAYKPIDEGRIRKTIREELARLAHHDGVAIGNMNILVQEVYDLATRANVLQVSGGTIVVRSPYRGDTEALWGSLYQELTSKVVLPERALGAPALVSFDNRLLLLAWTGTDEKHHLCVASSHDGRTFHKEVALSETSIDGPGFTYGNGQAFLAWAGTDEGHHLNMMSSYNFREFGNKVVLEETSSYGPALAFGNGHLYLAWTGTDPHHTLCVMSSSDGRTFTNKITLSETSSSGPALSFIDGRLYLLWCGTDPNHSLCMLESMDAVNFTNKVCLGEESDGHPALAKQNVFFFVWTGRDREYHLNLRTSGNLISELSRSDKMLYVDTSFAGPTLANFKGRLYCGWAGTDDAHHITVAMLS